MPEQKKRKFYRIICAVIGITIISIGLTFIRYAALGLDPVTSLNTGIANQLGISFGTWHLIIFSIMLAWVFFADRSKIGFGTVYNIVTIGYVSDFLLWLLRELPLFQSFFLQLRIASFLFGLVVLYFGAAVYIEAKTGLAPYDAIAIIIAEKIKRPNAFKLIRMGTDALCVFGGVLTNSDVGIGTLITVLCAGPIIAFFRKRLVKLKIFQALQG